MKKYSIKDIKELHYNLILGVIAFGILFGAYGFYEHNKKENKSQLEKLADENKNGKLEDNEKIKMYKMCGLNDTTKYLSSLSLEKGIENYKKHLKTNIYNKSH